MKLYISGPMTGMSELNFPAFHRAAAHYRSCGYVVVNPAEVQPWRHSTTWLGCMREDIKELADCDGIAMLEGWERSKGAVIEHYIATALGFEVINYRPNLGTK